MLWACEQDVATQQSERGISLRSRLCRAVYGHGFAISLLVSCEVRPARSAPRDQRAQGRPGARCTRGLAGCCKRDMLPTSIQVQRRAPGLPCAMALRLIRDRPGDRLSCHHRLLEALASHGLDASTGASDPNDFTVRCNSFVSRAAASTAPCPSSATMANAPLTEQDAGILNLIWGNQKAEYFRSPGWTKPMRDLPVGQHKRLGVEP